MDYLSTAMSKQALDLSTFTLVPEREGPDEFRLKTVAYLMWVRNMAHLVSQNCSRMEKALILKSRLSAIVLSRLGGVLELRSIDIDIVRPLVESIEEIVFSITHKRLDSDLVTALRHVVRFSKNILLILLPDLTWHELYLKKLVGFINEASDSKTFEEAPLGGSLNVFEVLGLC